MNTYARLSSVKRQLQGAGTGSSNDAVLLDVLEGVSRGIDSHCDPRHFYAWVGTRAVNPRGDVVTSIPNVISVTAIADADGVAVSADDYELRAGRIYPARGFARRPFSVTGVFGFSYETRPAGMLSAGVDAVAIEIPLAVGFDVEVTDTLVIGDEQMDVTAQGVASVTVQRGINGTTPTAHLADAGVARRIYPADVQQATIMQTARIFRESQTGFSGSAGAAQFGGYSFSTTYPMIRDLLAPYVTLGFA